MKKFVPMLLTVGVMASIAGCAAETDSVSVEVSQTPAVAPVVDAADVAPAVSKTVEGVLVSLSVPNMT